MIEQILTKLEIASNTGKPGALTEAELVKLKLYVVEAEVIRETTRECARRLVAAVK